MTKFARLFLIMTLFLSVCNISLSQVPSFTAPDTVCINDPVNIINTTVGATNYYWNFCVADINKAPAGTNLGNPGGNLSAPVFMDYAFYNGNYYGFVVNFNPGSLIRLDFGNSLLNTPTSVNLGNFGGILPVTNSAEGLRLIQNEGRWYVIMVGGYSGGPSPRVLKIDFGANLDNPSPTATDWGNPGNMDQPIDFDIFQDNNNNWFGFAINANNNTITRFNFTNSFNNTPTAINLGNVGNLAYPTGIYIANDNGNYKVFITNAGDNTRSSGTFSLSRLDFGTSLLNNPIGVNLGNPGNLLQHPRDFTIMRSCGQTIGFAVNGHLNNRDIIKFDFNGDLSTVPTATSLGNIGNLSFAHSISRLFRINEDIYSFVTNVDNSTITRLRFTGCNNASIPNSTVQHPPAIKYNTPGTYNINLTIDDGLPTQNATCRQVVVMAAPVAAATQQKVLCSGNTIRIGTGTKYATYTWNTGAVTDSIDINSPGTYWVQINRFGCVVTDSIVVTGSSCIVNAGFTAPDTICINNTVNITNTSVGATNYYWNFCVADITQAPIGTNLGNIGGDFSQPVFMDYVFSNGNYYGFITNHIPGKLTRLDFGNSLLNTPTSVNLGDFGGIIPTGMGAEGIQVIQNEGKWYAIIVGGSTFTPYPPRILKISFGTNITNPAPIATNWGNLGNMDQPIDLNLFQEGNNWYGFTVNALNNTITRFNFTNSFENTPAAVNMGNLGGLDYPTGIYTINDNGNYRVFISNAGNVPSLTRLDFGSSLLNNPAAVNLGNPGNRLSSPRDLTLMRSCGQAVAFVVVGRPGFADIVRYDFNNDLSSVPTATSLGNIGNLDFPHSISRLFRVNEDIFGFVTNVTNNTLTRLRFSGCNNSSIPSSTAENPPPIKYNAPGTYNINLTIDDGLPTQNTVCKQVVVMPAPVQSPTQQRKVCTAKTIRIGTGTKNVSYLWNTGATTDSIDVTAGGTYWVDMEGFGCKVADTFVVRSSSCNAPTLSNVINDYTEVLAYNQCDNSLLVNNAGAYKIGDTVLLIQMKGSVIDSSNTSAFGTIKDYRSAGNYEFNYIAGKNGNTLLLKNVLLRTYNIPDGKVQLVRVPYYQSAIITSTLTSLPWDGGKGGVLAFNVKDTLELEADMDVSANGFRKALPLNSTLVACDETGWYYDASTNKGAQKGEGIYNIGASRNYGRGAPSNGGGGGNGHNAGGGGGANAGAGGEGGNQWEGCATITELVGGKGGNALQNSALLNKLYAGGSGGMGEGNDHAEFPSGSGGGIIVLTAGVFIGNGHIIKANGENAAPCPSGACGDGMSGGGAGGSVVLGITNAIDLVNIEAKGGNGADHVSANNYRHGPGGGGGGGFVAITQSVASPLYKFNTTGGKNGVNTNFGNDARGAKAGGNGTTINAFNIAVSSVPFVKNIDSVRLGIDTASCSSFNFKGMGYTKNTPIQSWLWTFGDGQTAATQNAFHEYTARGSFPVKLTGTDINGCKDSITTTLAITSYIFDFSYKQDLCNPLSVQFFNVGNNTKDPYWSIGDGNTITGIVDPTHAYTTFGDYTVKFSIHEGACIDTVTKVISINVIKDDMIITPDTVVCAGATKQLRTRPSLSFCWFPTTYLSDPHSPNPVTSTPQNITYYFNAEVPGNNLIVNGDFSAGNTGFTSQYAFALPNTTEGQYAVGPNPQLWNSAASNCRDHTSGNGNMLLVNGNPIADEKVWVQTVNVIPNSNYAFSTWIQSISEANPAQLQFSINGKDMAGAITATLPGCNWQQFYTTWNSGNNTTAIIAIVNKNTIRSGNDFALDDISFAPVLIKRDSVVITVEKPVVKTNKDTTICAFKPVPLSTTGAAQYSWTPQAGLSNPSIGNPVASPVANTSYIVTGTTIHGCVAKDTVAVSLFTKPLITKTADTAVCRNSSLPLFVSGGQTYSWSPAAGLSNPAIQGPVAFLGTTDVTYAVKITDNHSCDYMDSVKIAIRPYPVFRATGNKAICFGSPTTLQASGGDIYQWTPANLLNDPNAQAPVTSPEVTTQYSVHIAESTCHFDTTINMTIRVNPIPQLVVQKVNDINCNTPSTQLKASGALQYTWSPSTGLDNPNIANPVSTADSSTIYLLEGTNQFGCTASTEVPVTVTKDGLPRFVVPNAFTPNGDGNNDCFGIKRWGNARIQEFSVFNRWGQLVFKTNTPAQCWDGTFNGKPQDTGGYVYIIKATTLCGEITRKGIVMLVR